MLNRQRFGIYRKLMADSNAKGFVEQKVWPLEAPQEQQIEVESVAPELPRLKRAKNFPISEHAKERFRDIRKRGLAFPLITGIPARSNTPIADNLAGLLEQIYPKAYRDAWPEPPVLPPELEAADILAALAVSGPFAMYLKSASTLADLAAATAGNAGPNDFVMDMSWFDAYKPKPGLLAPGGIGIFAVDGDHLRTHGIMYEGQFVAAGAPSFERAQKVLLCALNTHVTTLLHNVTFHLAYVTSLAVASNNALQPDHPIRRLLHPGFHTTLIGNYEVAKFQIVGKRSFATRLFSHDYPTLVRMINDHLDTFRIADLDPDVWFARNGLADAPFPLPFWDDAMAVWKINLAYVERYIALYYASDEEVAADAQLQNWMAQLDDLLPGGLYDDHGYLSAGEPLTRASLVRICATYLHTSSATHDVVNNEVWDYSTLNYVIPTVVPESLEQQDVRLSFDFLTTLIGTWKEYNMLVDGISELALDEEGRRIMDDYVQALRDRQEEMDKSPHQPGRIYPAAFNPSVSN